MNKKKGFTFMELLIVIAILGIMVSVAIPAIAPTIKYTEKNTTNTVHKILIGAIDAWVKDNYDAAQRPDNFLSKNSQGHSVYEYITNREVYDKSNLVISTTGFTVGPEEEEKVFVEFKKGVLTSSYIKKLSATPEFELKFGVYELDSGKQVKDYAQKVSEGYIVVNDYKEVGQP